MVARDGRRGSTPHCARRPVCEGRQHTGALTRPSPLSDRAPLACEGAADPSYLLAEVRTLRAIAEQSGLGALAYVLECQDRVPKSIGRKQERDEGL